MYSGASLLGLTRLYPLYASGSRLYQMTALSETQVRAFFGLYHSGGELAVSMTKCYARDDVEIAAPIGTSYTPGVEYYLSLTGPALLTSIADGSWTKRLGIGQPNGKLLAQPGDAFCKGASVSGGSTSDVAGEALALGDVLFQHSDGKIYKFDGTAGAVDSILGICTGTFALNATSVTWYGIGSIYAKAGTAGQEFFAKHDGTLALYSALTVGKWARAVVRILAGNRGLVQFDDPAVVEAA